jgi:hypothetical protein
MTVAGWLPGGELSGFAELVAAAAVLLLLLYCCCCCCFNG